MVRDHTVTVTVHLNVPDTTPVQTRRMLAYMAQHCDEVTLASLAAHEGICPMTAQRLLVDALQVTFSKVLAEMRMQRAAALLDEGVDVAQAARCCGYSSVSRFRAAFRQRWGTSPMAWAEGGAGRDDLLSA